MLTRVIHAVRGLGGAGPAGLPSSAVADGRSCLGSRRVEGNQAVVGTYSAHSFGDGAQGVRPAGTVRWPVHHTVAVGKTVEARRKLVPEDTSFEGEPVVVVVEVPQSPSIQEAEHNE